MYMYMYVDTLYVTALLACTCTCRYPDTEQLQTVYGTYLLPVLQHSLANHPVWGSTARIHALAGSMVQVYEQVRLDHSCRVDFVTVRIIRLNNDVISNQVRKHFTVDDYSHYVFTPRDLTQWVLGLIRYPLAQDTGNGVSSGHLLEMWAYEARRLFRDRLVGEKAVDQFDAILNSVLQSDWSTSVSSLDQEGGAFYVTWGSPQSSKHDGASGQFGRPLGRLSAADMQEVVARAVTTFSKLHISPPPPPLPIYLHTLPPPLIFISHTHL